MISHGEGNLQKAKTTKACGMPRVIIHHLQGCGISPEIFSSMLPLRGTSHSQLTISKIAIFMFFPFSRRVNSKTKTQDTVLKHPQYFKFDFVSTSLKLRFQQLNNSSFSDPLGTSSRYTLIFLISKPRKKWAFLSPGPTKQYCQGMCHHFQPRLSVHLD